MAFPAPAARFRAAPDIIRGASPAHRPGRLSHRARAILFAAAVALAVPSAASPRPAAHPLDRARVHGLYQEGEFEKLVRELSAYGKGECSCTRDDSAFAEKHLAVVLAANPSTRELGRYHMFRLLDLSPHADLLDMYVGEEVDGVFEKVRKEHDLRAADAKPPAKPRIPAHAAAPAPDPIPDPATASSAPASAPANTLYSEAWTRPNTVTASYPAAASRAAKADHPPAERAAASRLQSRAAPRHAPMAAPNRPPSHGRAAAPSAPSAYSPWDRLSADASGSKAAPASVRDPAAPAPVVSAIEMTIPADASPAGRPASAADSSRPVWKEPGLWIGGGAALAAIAFTLWHAGSEDAAPGKTYAVPSSLSK